MHVIILETVALSSLLHNSAIGNNYLAPYAGVSVVYLTSSYSSELSTCCSYSNAAADWISNLLKDFFMYMHGLVLIQLRPVRWQEDMELRQL